MKSVLISIHQRNCENIVSGKKTIEVRKTAPKLKTPFKCYIYETKKDDGKLFEFVHDGDELYGKKYHGKAFHVKGAPLGWTEGMQGKVIGEFVCDEIEAYSFPYSCADGGISVDELKATCLRAEEFCRYGAGKTLYGWHISDLKIYNKPKELWELCMRCKVSCANCKDPAYYNPFIVPGCEEKGVRKVMRPPQSWMYVEEI